MTTKLTPAERKAREAIVADDARFDALLEAAFKVEAPDVAVGRRTRSRRRPAVFALAASVLLAAGAWFGLRTESPVHDVSPLAPAVIAHIRHEPAALVVTASIVSQEKFDDVLRAGRAALAGPVGQVSYARLCPFRGRMVAHFVVQGERGPVTVMLLPDEDVAAPMPIDEEGFTGTLVPIEGGGSMAIVGWPDEPLEEIRARLLQALRWSI
jgi:hypothetical protein